MNDYAQAALLMAIFLGIIAGIVALVYFSIKAFAILLMLGCFVGLYSIALSIVRG